MFKYGEEVIVRLDLKGDSNDYKIYCNQQMTNYCGKKFIIYNTGITSRGILYYVLSRGKFVLNWKWTEDMLIPCSRNKHFINLKFYV